MVWNIGGKANKLRKHFVSRTCIRNGCVTCVARRNTDKKEKGQD